MKVCAASVVMSGCTVTGSGGMLRHSSREWTNAGTAGSGAGTLPAFRRRRSTGSPSSLDLVVDAGDVVDVGHPVGVFEVQQGIQRPVQVISEVRDLLAQTVGRVRDYSPRRLPDRSMVNSCVQAGQVTAARVWPSVLTRR